MNNTNKPKDNIKLDLSYILLEHLLSSKRIAQHEYDKALQILYSLDK